MKINFFIFTLFFIISTMWLWMAWGPAPLIVDNGDAGNVSSIVASLLYPDRFMTDPVFSNQQHFNFYWAISIPLTKILSFFTGDIGQAYIFFILPIIFFQLMGFYLLGIQLYAHRGFAFLLALMSIAPVYVLGGELWGQLAVPLTRSYYLALFPYFLLLTLQENQKAWFPFLVMALCGLTIYVHPVSTPSVAFALLTALLGCKPQQRTWKKHIFLLMSAGLLFIVLVAPFMLNFFKVFPSGASQSIQDNTSLAAQFMMKASGEQYYSVVLAFKKIIHGGGNPLHGEWNAISFSWIILLIGLILLSKKKRPSKELSFYLSLLITLTIISIGVSIIDSILAIRMGRNPASWGWCWLVWLTGFAGLIIKPSAMPKEEKKISHERKFFLFFLLGLLLATFGISAIDQLIAKIRSQHPIEIDLIRNTKFIIPLLLIGMIRYLVILNDLVIARYRGGIFVLSSLLCLAWWSLYPIPLTTLVNQQLAYYSHLNLSNPINNSANRHLLEEIKKLPPNSKILAFPPHSDNELLLLAIRYAAFQPIAHLKKDLNFLSYSGSGKQIIEWEKIDKKLNDINQANPKKLSALLLNFMQEHHIHYLLVYLPDVLPSLLKTLHSEFALHLQETDFALFSMNVKNATQLAS